MGLVPVYVAIPVQRFNQLSYEATDIGSWSCVGSKDMKSLALLDFKSTVQYMIPFIYHFIS